ncbi:MAG: hypothetical protein KH005_03880, partial [Clostridium sp.]|nr:hypothetical protein [Clostridium sp.]
MRIYFFNSKNSIENGKLWAKHVKKFSYYSIIEAELNVNKDKILDLDGTKMSLEDEKDLNKTKEEILNLYN